MIDYQELLLEALLLENQLEYLSKKYADVNPELIQQAIDLDKKNAEKLVLGLQKGVIDKLDQDSVAAVADLDPFAKVSRKSEADLAYEAEIRAAKQISPKYWQWVLRVKRADRDAYIDPGIFHYLDAEDKTTDDILDKSLAEVSEDSQRWHAQQFADQQTHGKYTKTPENSAMLKLGSYFWVPVDQTDALVEGGKMQNCIGKYCIPSDTTKIFSLRNSFNNPHISLSLRKNNDIWYVSEIKGKQNKSPMPKYIPYIFPFLEKLFQKGAVPAGDFWRLDHPDVVKYVNYINQPIPQVLPQKMIDLVSDEVLNANAVKYGIRGFDKQYFKRLSSDTIIKVLESPATKSPIQLLKYAILYGNLNEEQTLQLLEKHGGTRSVKMIIKAKFRPEEFIAEIKKLDPEDFVLAIDNYIESLEAYPYTDEYFGAILNSPSTRLHERYWSVIISKCPTSDIIRYLQSHSGQDPNISYNNSYVYQTIVKELLSRITKPNISDYVSLFSLLSPSTDLTKEQINDIIFGLDYDDLPALYHASKHIIELRNALETFLINVGLLPDQVSKDDPSSRFSRRKHLARTAGTSEDVVDAAEFILNTDDRDQLLELRRATNSRGVKVMIDRKIARMNRAKVNAK